MPWNCWRRRWMLYWSQCYKNRVETAAGTATIRSCKENKKMVS